MHFRQTSSYITYVYWYHIFILGYQLGNVRTSHIFSSPIILRERNGIFFVTKTLFLLSKTPKSFLRLRGRQTRTTTRTNRVALLYETTEREKKRCPKKERTKLSSSNTDRGALVAVLRAVVSAKSPGRRRRMSGRCRRQRLPDRMRREHERGP